MLLQCVQCVKHCVNVDTHASTGRIILGAQEAVMPTRRLLVDALQDIIQLMVLLVHQLVVE